MEITGFSGMASGTGQGWFLIATGRHAMSAPVRCCRFVRLVRA